jgi:hypothetical protein
MKQSTARNSSVDLDVLAVLLEAPNCTLRCTEIKKKLRSKYVPKLMGDGYFLLNISRSLARLTLQGLVKRDDRGHQQVFYMIPEQKRNTLEEEMQKIRNVELFIKLDVSVQQWLLAENQRKGVSQK